MEVDPRDSVEVRQQVDQGIQDLEHWNRLWADMMVVVSQWGDSTECKTTSHSHSLFLLLEGG